LPDTYHLAGHGRGTATLKFYEGRDILPYLITPGVPALPGRVLLERGPDTAAAQLRIDAERLDVTFPERHVIEHDRRPAFIGADHLDQVTQEADAPVTVEGTEHMRFCRGGKTRGQMTVLGQDPGRQAEHIRKPCRPRLNLSHLHHSSRLGLGVIHLSIMPSAGAGTAAWARS
jgi:hypothetical protein